MCTTSHNLARVQGATSNQHALRMVGTLQTETDRLRQESEASRREVSELKAAMQLKLEDAEHWMSERTILGNRQNDLRQVRVLEHVWNMFGTCLEHV